MDSPKRFSTIETIRGVDISVHFINPSLLMGITLFFFLWFCSYRVVVPALFFVAFIAVVISTFVDCIEASCALFSASRWALAAWRATSTGHTNVAYSHLLNPHSKAAGNRTANKRYLGRKKWRPFTKSPDRKTFTPLLKEVPATSIKNRKLCHVLNGW